MLPSVGKERKINTPKGGLIPLDQRTGPVKKKSKGGMSWGLLTSGVAGLLLAGAMGHQSGKMALCVGLGAIGWSLLSNTLIKTGSTVSEFAQQKNEDGETGAIGKITQGLIGTGVLGVGLAGLLTLSSLGGNNQQNPPYNSAAAAA